MPSTDTQTDRQTRAKIRVLQDFRKSDQQTRQTNVSWRIFFSPSNEELLLLVKAGVDLHQRTGETIYELNRTFVNWGMLTGMGSKKLTFRVLSLHRRKRWRKVNSGNVSFLLLHMTVYISQWMSFLISWWMCVSNQRKNRLVEYHISNSAGSMAGNFLSYS